MRGIITPRGDYVKREQEDAKLRMGGGSWSINLKELDMTQVGKIYFVTPENIYSVTAGDALTHGFNRTLGGESKLVVPLKHWKVEQRDTPRKKT